VSCLQAYCICKHRQDAIQYTVQYITHLLLTKSFLSLFGCWNRAQLAGSGVAALAVSAESTI
jgi:hypothetical protein